MHSLDAAHRRGWSTSPMFMEGQRKNMNDLTRIWFNIVGLYLRAGGFLATCSIGTTSPTGLVGGEKKRPYNGQRTLRFHAPGSLPEENEGSLYSEEEFLNGFHES